MLAHSRLCAETVNTGNVKPKSNHCVALPPSLPLPSLSLLSSFPSPFLSPILSLFSPISLRLYFPFPSSFSLLPFKFSKLFCFTEVGFMSLRLASTCCVAEGSLGFLILSPLHPQSWGYRCSLYIQLMRSRDGTPTHAR